MFTPGQRITVNAYKSDGVCYRTWETTIEKAQEVEVITFNQAGNTVTGSDRTYVMEHAFRSFYWLEKPYNLLEVYWPDGSLYEIYIHLCSPAVLGGATIHYIDWELDVVRYPGKPAFLVDEDEFEEASRQYTYTPEFRAACYQTIREIMELASTWVPQGLKPVP